MEKKPGKIHSFWFWLLIIIILVGLGIGIYQNSKEENFQPTINGQLEKLREKKVTQAYYDYSSKEFQKKVSLREFRNFIARYDVLSENKSFTITKEDLKNSTGLVMGILMAKNLHEMSAEYELVKEDNEWKIEDIVIGHVSEANHPIAEQLEKKVFNQLSSLRDDDIVDAYYGFFSRQFLTDISFQEFEKYVRSNPILTSFKSLNVLKIETHDDFAFIDLTLNSDIGHFNLEYKLKTEDGQWKIWSLYLVLTPEEAAKKIATDPVALEIPLREFLDALFLNNIESAYSATSKEFQHTVQLPSFEKFVRAYSVLTRPDLTDIKEGSIENGIGRLSVHMHDKNGMTIFEFQLGYEDGGWKIWAIQASENPQKTSSIALQEIDPKEGKEAKPSEEEQKMTISEVAIGDDINANGIIVHPRLVLDSALQNLYVNIKIEHGQKGALVSLFLTQTDKGYSAPPLSTILSKEGETTIAFSYAEPTDGWPEGNYLLKVTLSNGEQESQKFQLIKGEKKFY